jgi:hypothetical protein
MPVDIAFWIVVAMLAFPIVVAGLMRFLWWYGMRRIASGKTEGRLKVRFTLTEKSDEGSE